MAEGQLDRIDEENEEDNNDEIASNEEIRKDTNLNSIEDTAHEELPSGTRQVRGICDLCKKTIKDHPRSIQPCWCGTWDHHHCLVSTIQSIETKHPLYTFLGCNICLMRYNIWPRKNLVVEAMEKVSVRYGQFTNFGFHALGVVLVDTVFTVIGLCTLEIIYGHKRTAKLLLSLGSLKAMAICKTIPLVSIAVNSIPWEDKLLQFLRRCSELPFVGWMFPSADLRVRERKHRSTHLGVFMGGIMLPLHANKLGFLIFGAVQSRLQRFLLGGVAFLALKGALQMYYRQKLYARQCSLTVEAYNGD